MGLDETNKQVVRLVNFLASGASASVETKLREIERQKQELQARVNELENETAAKPADIAKIDWKDSLRLRDNLRATIKRMTVDAASKSFCAEFLDGRAYDFELKGDEVTITIPDSPEEWKQTIAA